MSPPPPVALKNRYLAAFLAFLVPGLGHFYQGRVLKGLIYLVCILGLYVVGFALGDGRIVVWRWVNPLNDPEHFCLHFPGQFWVGIPGLFALLQATLVHQNMMPLFSGFMTAPPVEMPGMSMEMQELTERLTQATNGLYYRRGKLLEVGLIYTTIAGLLNILAIYDAYDGPAADDEPEAKVEGATSEPQANAGAEVTA